ncbi:MAG: ankyrin repeat domain-containing protein, partial [Planctomycetota bacterium]|nr:ankyrin repeat domain-containing protein [Planctomycetota bacterium]
MGNTKVVKQHLASGTDANSKDPNGAPILNAAAVYGHREIVDALVQKGANINGKDNDGNSALHSAAFLGRTEVVEYLLEKGVDANIKNNKSETPSDVLKVDWGTTQFVAGLLQIQVNQQSV